MAAEQFHSKLAGVSFENDDGTSRVKIISQYAKPGATIFLKREPDNPHGATATSAWIRIDNTSFDLVQIGYLKTELTNELAPKMDAGDEVNVMISEITGGTRSKKNVGVNIRVEVTSSKSKISMTSQPQEIDIETPKVKKLNVFDWFRMLYFNKRRLFWLVITGVLVSGCCLVTGIFSLINPSPSSEPPAAEELTVEELVAQMMETQQAEDQPTAELIPTVALLPAVGESSCQPASEMQRMYIEEGLEGENYIQEAYTVRSTDYAEVWIIAAKIYGPGIEYGEGPGVWAITGSPEEPGIIMSVNEFAKGFTPFPDGAETDAMITIGAAGVREAMDCAK